MKHFAFLLVVSFVLPLATMAQKTKEGAGCEANLHLNNCIASLKPKGYRYLKSYKITNTDKKNLEYEYTFSKGMSYLISLEGANPTALSVNLYDNSGKLIASNYKADNKKYYPSVGLRVQRTGIYKIKFSPTNQKESVCGAGVLGFKR